MLIRAGLAAAADLTCKLRVNSNPGLKICDEPLILESEYIITKLLGPDAGALQ